MSGCGCGHGAVAALALRGLVGHCCPGAPALQDFDGRCCPGVAALRVLAAAMLIAGKRNRSPQNVAGRDNGSSQGSLLW